MYDTAPLAHVAMDRDEAALLAELLADFKAGLKSGDTAHDNWDADDSADMTSLDALHASLTRASGH